MREFAVVFGLSALIVGFVVAMALFLTSRGCASAAAKMGFTHNYGPLQGCMIETPRGWVPLSSFRANREAD